MLDKIPLSHILFLDIETVPAYPSLGDVPSDFKALWERKALQIRKSEEDTPESLYHRAGIYAEFGKVICISCGMFTPEGNFRIKSFFGDDEKTVLSDFATLCDRSFSASERYLCAHNGKEFDFPYLSRRMLINSIRLPGILDTPGKKPWEVSHLDTHELWKFGDYKSFTTLNLLAAVFGIPTPKDDIDGSKVWEVYWLERNLPRIVTYCQKDTLTVAQIYLRFRGEPILEPSQVEIVS
jgi:predicted PolB exonuclease-like 3'-5' exonuclease